MCVCSADIGYSSGLYLGCLREWFVQGSILGYCILRGLRREKRGFPAFLVFARFAVFSVWGFSCGSVFSLR